MSDRYQKPCGLGAIAEGPADHEKHFTLSELGATEGLEQRIALVSENCERITVAAGREQAVGEPGRTRSPGGRLLQI